VRDGAFSLGRVLGVEIRLHATWFFVFLLVVVSLATMGTRPGETPVSLPVRLLLAALVAVLFFGSVVLHELAHAVVARRHGIMVREITLFIFGGAATLEQESPDPRTELLVAGVGPLSSAGIAGVFFAAWLLLSGSGSEPLQVLAGPALELASINLLLAAFNLIPGFPMDGGRLLRAVVWGATKDFVRATRIATRVGRIFAYLLIGIGFVIALRVDVVGGLWLSFIGWFLNHAAEASYKRVALEKLMEGIRVQDVMEREVASVSPNLTLDTLVDQHLLSGRASLYPVIHDGDLVGTVEIGQVSRVPRGDWSVTRVTDVMTRGTGLVTLTEPQPLWQAVTRFEESGTPAIPVVDAEDGRRLLGLVTRDGVFRALRARAQLRA
jgi:Zn-dependent protease/predicted transcriptional regulator